jgi:hypothetical protein
MTDEELKELVASLAVAQRETDRQLKETDRQLKETDRQLKETDRQLKETDRQLRKQLKELGKQIGGLGEKFGGFTEGMALPSMTKILTENFGMEVVTPRVKVRKAGRSLELDVLAYANSECNAAYIVEIKSHLRPDGIEQLQKILEQFRHFLPEHADKALYGILAVVDAPEDLRQEALSAGIFMAGINDEQFKLEVPSNFQPKAW